MRVICEILETDLENDYGSLTHGVIATCSECQHQTESFGRTIKSIRRCMILMKEECPEGHNNFYVPDSEGEDT